MHLVSPLHYWSPHTIEIVLLSIWFAHTLDSFNAKPINGFIERVMRLLLDVVQIVLPFYLAASPTNALEGMTTNKAIKLEHWGPNLEV
jgi:hypothetical protein